MPKKGVKKSCILGRQQEREICHLFYYIKINSNRWAYELEYERLEYAF